MELLLINKDTNFCYLLEDSFKELSGAIVINDTIDQLGKYTWDCFITGGNSFGITVNSLDYAIRDYFGYELEQNIQQLIIEKYKGELLVGQSELIFTPRNYVAYSPIVRTSQSIKFTDNVYNAMWAALLEIDHHNKNNNIPILIVACPGLGVGYGAMMESSEAARQMALAYKNWLNPPVYIKQRDVFSSV